MTRVRADSNWSYLNYADGRFSSHGTRPFWIDDDGNFDPTRAPYVRCMTWAQNGREMASMHINEDTGEAIFLINLGPATVDVYCESIADAFELMTEKLPKIANAAAAAVQVTPERTLGD